MDSGGKNTESTTCAYDAKGNRTEMAFYNADGSLRDTSLYSYNDKGNRTELACYNTDGSWSSKTCYAYTYDASGNWTKQIESNEVTEFGKTYFAPLQLTERTITYYP